MNWENIKVETYIPQNYFTDLLEALNSISALVIENYDSCVSTSIVSGYWRPLEGADPFEGLVGELCRKDEMKVEFKSKYKLIESIIEKIKEVHPYEAPVINIFPLIE